MQDLYVIIIFLNNGHAISLPPIEGEDPTSDECDKILAALLNDRPYKIKYPTAATWIFPADFKGLKYKLFNMAEYSNK